MLENFDHRFYDYLWDIESFVNNNLIFRAQDSSLWESFRWKFVWFSESVRFVIRIFLIFMSVEFFQCWHDEVVYFRLKFLLLDQVHGANSCFSRRVIWDCWSSDIFSYWLFFSFIIELWSLRWQIVLLVNVDFLTLSFLHRW